MPIYTWEGKSNLGEIKKGELVADNLVIARLQLRKQNITPMRILEKKEKSAQKTAVRKKIPTKSIVVFMRMFATMINAGLPMVQCLNILAAQQENPAFAKVITWVKGDVESGLSLSEGLKKHPKIFDQLYTNLVDAGEAGGILDVILSRLSSYIEKAEKLKKKIKGAMVYPAVVTGVAVVVTMVILILVIPIFEKMFSEVGQALPVPPQFVITLSRFMSKNIIFMILGAVGLVFLLRRLYATEKGKYFIDNVMNAINKTDLKSGKILAAGKKNVFASGILSLAAGFMILLGIGGIGIMAHYNGGAKGKPASRPCLLTSTPGGLLERDMRQSAINNGMQIEARDIIRTYAGSDSFLLYSDLSRIEIGGGSTVKFSEVSGRDNGKPREGGRNLYLGEGIIEADILKSKDNGTFKVDLPRADLTAGDARFIAAASDGVIFVEVTCGSVSLKLADQEKPLTIEAGYCLVVSKEGTSKLLTTEPQPEGFKADARLAELKKRLSLSESKFEELLVNLQKRKNVDICLKNTINSIKRRGANYS